MAPVRNASSRSSIRLLPAANLIPHRQPRPRLPRKFTARRMDKVSRFMEAFVANPRNHHRYGTAEWMNELIRNMDEHPRYGIFIDDVRHWLNTEPYFIQWRRNLNAHRVNAENVADNFDIILHDPPMEQVEVNQVIQEFPQMIRQRQEHSAVMLDILNHLRNAGGTAINVEECSRAVKQVRWFLARVDN